MRNLVDEFLHLLTWICMAVMFFGVLFLCAWMYPPMHEAKKADCALVEFSPDYSAEIKQLCRDARSKK